MPSRRMIADFLQQKRLAVVGVSRNAKEFPNTVFRKLQAAGHDVIPVNPNAEQVEGLPCYPSVLALPEPVDGVLVMLPADKAAPVVRECREAGISRVWLYKSSPEAHALGEQAGMKLVEDACPHMFLGGFPHNVHGWFTHVDP